MKEDLWVQVQEAFAEAVELPPEARKRFLDETYGTRPDVRLEVESLLEYQAAAERLDRSAIVLATAKIFDADEADDGAGLIGTVVGGKYRIRERLGEGGMAEVYVADHTVLNVPFAIKCLKPFLRSDPEFRKSFLEEARRAATLKHDNVARLHDVVEAGEDLVVVMEYVEGETLRSRLAALGASAQPTAVDEFLPIALQCASGLAAAHEKRIIHLDVKPENIMLTPAGQVKICDFGVARRLPENHSTAPAAMLAGTPAYMAPEVVLDQAVDERADLFSLGAVFYEMLSGHNPFTAGTVALTTSRVASHTPPPLSSIRHDIDPRLERIVARMLAKDPNQRYAAAGHVLSELRTIERSCNRFQNIIHNVGEALTESVWVKVAAAIVVLFALFALVVPLVCIYRPIAELLGMVRLSARETIVVLPFRITGDSSSQNYANGLTYALTEKLGEMRQFRVISTVVVLQSEITTPRQAFGLFGANLAVLGSIHRTDDAFQIVLSLADGGDGKHLRGKTLRASRLDSLAVQTEVVEAVLGLLDLEVRSRAQPCIARSWRSEHA